MSGPETGQCTVLMVRPSVAILMISLAACLALLAVAVVLGAISTGPRRIMPERRDDQQQWLIDARHEVIQRMSHFEQLLVAIGSVELGILSYMAGVVISNVPQFKSPIAFYTITSFLTFVTTVAYLHDLSGLHGLQHILCSIGTRGGRTWTQDNKRSLLSSAEPRSTCMDEALRCSCRKYSSGLALSGFHPTFCCHRIWDSLLY
jgi:hypothetical protein